MTQFEVGKEYGNDFTFTVVKRTAKTITINSVFGEARVKVRNYSEDFESIHYKAWAVYATEAFDAEVAAENSLYRAYCL